jgi:uncharacterized protein (DUF1778 family)
MNEKNNRDRRITIRLTEEEYDSLLRTCKRTGKNLSEQIRFFLGFRM